MKLIEDESLEAEWCHISEHLQGWISNCGDLLYNIKIPVLNKKAFILEAKRTWTFVKAFLLDDHEYIQHHSELLSKLINTALSSGDDVAPFISVAYLPDASHTLKLKLFARQTATRQDIYALVCDLAKLASRE